MVARSYRGFSLASPDPLTTVFTFLHITPSPGELNFNGLINGLPCPLASCWYQSMWGSSRTRVGLTCSFSHLPACGVNLRWLCSSAKDHSFRLGRKTTHSVADPPLTSTSPGMVMSSELPLLVQQIMLSLWVPLTPALIFVKCPFI